MGWGPASPPQAPRNCACRPENFGGFGAPKHRFHRKGDRELQPAALYPLITPPCQDPIFSTIIPVGYIRKSPPQVASSAGPAAQFLVLPPVGRPDYSKIIGLHECCDIEGVVGQIQAQRDVGNYICSCNGQSPRMSLYGGSDEFCVLDTDKLGL